jgi:hypothetical protein
MTTCHMTKPTRHFRFAFILLRFFSGSSTSIRLNCSESSFLVNKRIAPMSSKQKQTKRSSASFLLSIHDPSLFQCLTSNCREARLWCCRVVYINCFENTKCCRRRAARVTHTFSSPLCVYNMLFRHTNNFVNGSHVIECWYYYTYIHI